MKGFLRCKNDGWIIEVPDDLTNLYELKDGQEFRISVTKDEEHLFLHMITKLS